MLGHPDSLLGTSQILTCALLIGCLLDGTTQSHLFYTSSFILGKYILFLTLWNIFQPNAEGVEEEKLGIEEEDATKINLENEFQDEFEQYGEGNTFV